MVAVSYNPQVDASLAARLVAGGARLIDVREPGEYDAERIPGSELAPLSAFDIYCPVDDGRPIIVTCLAGSRAVRASHRLIARGHPSVLAIAGGLLAWKAAGLPTQGPGWDTQGDD